MMQGKSSLCCSPLLPLVLTRMSMGPTSPLPAPPCCSPSFSAPCVLLHMHASQPVACILFSLCMLAGRSPTPLIDLERYQIEMLVDMGISDVELYRVALTAPSAVSTDQIVASSFDRLEFLGDSVVGLVFRSWVYNRLVTLLLAWSSDLGCTTGWTAISPVQSTNGLAHCQLVPRALMSCLVVIMCCCMASVLEQT